MRPLSYGSYGSCGSCGAFNQSAVAASQADGDAARFSLHGELSYGNTGQDACGLAAALPALTRHATPYTAPCGDQERMRSRYGNASSLAGMKYDWRTDALRIPEGTIFRQISQTARNVALGVRRDDPYSGQTRGSAPVNLAANGGWSALVNTAAGGLVAGGAPVNYAGLGAGQQGTSCTPQSQASFRQSCVASPSSYGVYKQYGVEMDALRQTPYRVAYSNPTQNPMGFSIADSGACSSCK
jgi:hypothetical protein